MKRKRRKKEEEKGKDYSGSEVREVLRDKLKEKRKGKKLNWI